MKKWQIMKLRDEVLCLTGIILGICITVCGFLKIVPGVDNAFFEAISIIIAYGCLIGPGLTISALVCFFIVRNTSGREYSKKAR